MNIMAVNIITEKSKMKKSDPEDGGNDKKIIDIARNTKIDSSTKKGFMIDLKKNNHIAFG